MRSAVVIAALALVACGAPQSAPRLYDGHNDLIGAYIDATPRFSLSERKIEQGLPGQVDGPRLKAGGYGGMLLTLSGGVAPGQGPYFAKMHDAFDWYDALLSLHPDLFARATTPAEARKAMAGGRIALTAAIEGAGQFDGRMENVVEAHRRGVRSVLLVYDHNDDVGDGAMAFMGSAEVAAPASGGLTPFGRELVGVLNDLGVIVDLSHAAESTALEALRLSRAPVIFSHSGVQGLAQTPRNVSDATLAALKTNGGIIMIPFVPYLATTTYWRWFDEGERLYVQLMTEHQGDPAKVGAAMDAWEAKSPRPKVAVAAIADQVEYAAARVGRDHVGIGTDFGGMGSFVVDGLEDAATPPALFAELKRRGWSAREIDGLASGNFLRTWDAVVTAAR